MDLRYAYVRLADEIEADIRSVRFALGAALPGERAMITEHGVSIDTVRRAVKVLRERGLVTTVPYKGSFVTGTPDAETPPPGSRNGDPDEGV
ncbi:winged helix-turn-helix domain-containing protein [Streptomyces sp. NPDC057238]|uniref:winged helix-turn-helix domain-containing protein n=1 Tax=Streptomyces sp. NPDC057238 TaxID=3346060 RepID=UPI003630A197